MSILLLLIPLALALGVTALWGFLYSSRNGQFDDLETPAYRALIDESEGKIE
jgi:cbb3-type cytochrome oxidase maturation protein